MVRINKWLSEMGVCSKKQADRLVAQGDVSVNGKLATVGMKLHGDEEVLVAGRRVQKRPNPVFLLYNKPVGVVCTHAQNVKNNLEAALPLSYRVFAVGRLDKDSEGLLLLTNQGDVVNKLMRAENKHEKVYRVWVDKVIRSEFLEAMAAGVDILGTTTLPCSVKQLEQQCFEIVLVQGLNRQIRRMCQVLGYRVERLQRVKIAGLDLANLPLGGYRLLTESEQKTLCQSLENSSNLPNT